MIKVGIVDDHQIFLEGISAILTASEDVEIVFVASNARDALQFIKKKEIDILITDISMPEMNGLELIHFVKKDLPNLKIIVMSTFQNIESKKNVDAYLLKNTSKEELLTVIKELHFYNKKYYYSEKINFGGIEFKKKLLSDREKEIVIAICEGLTTQEISNKLYISKNTVETHRKNIFFKLDVCNMAQLVSISIKLGFIDY